MQPQVTWRLEEGLLPSVSHARFSPSDFRTHIQCFQNVRRFHSHSGDLICRFHHLSLDSPVGNTTQHPSAPVSDGDLGDTPLGSGGVGWGGVRGTRGGATDTWPVGVGPSPSTAARRASHKGPSGPAVVLRGRESRGGPSPPTSYSLAGGWPWRSGAARLYGWAVKRAWGGGEAAGEGGGEAGEGGDGGRGPARHGGAGPSRSIVTGRGAGAAAAAAVAASDSSRTRLRRAGATARPTAHHVIASGNRSVTRPAPAVGGTGRSPPPHIIPTRG